MITKANMAWTVRRRKRNCLSVCVFVYLCVYFSVCIDRFEQQQATRQAHSQADAPTSRQLRRYMNVLTDSVESCGDGIEKCILGM